MTGDNGYHAAYSALSTAATASIAWGLFKHGRNGSGAPPAFIKPFGSAPIRIMASVTLTTYGLIGFSQLAPKLQIPVEINFGGSGDSEKAQSSSKSQVDAGNQETKQPEKPGFFKPKCPMDFRPVDMPEDGVYGMKRVTRNPNFWSLGLVGAGAALAATNAVKAVAFGFPLVFALVGGAHQDSRFRRGMGNTLDPKVEEKTSNVPFWALMTGKQSWSDLLNETKLLNAGIATLLAFIFVAKKTR